MLTSFHITLLIICGFLLALALIHAIRWTAIGLKHGWPPAVRGGEVPSPPDQDGHRVELSKGGAFDGRGQQ